jgi:XTP/dITP diphosphohydrolase
MQVILASSNKGKIREFKEILEPLGFEILSLSDINFTGEIIEDGNSFMENSLIKAKTIYEYTKKPVIADDSGICVLALDGAPGIYSARYGNKATDIDRRNHLLFNMKDIKDRTAYFCCSIIFYYKEGLYEHFEGRVYGNIDYEAKGVNGFGYDDVFIPTGYNVTFAETDSESKNKLSHRYKALKLFVEYLQNDFNN